MHSVDHMDDYKEFSVEQESWKAPILNEDYKLWWDEENQIVTLKSQIEEEADFIIKSGIYLPLDLLPKLEGNKFYFHEIIGFNVIDQTHGNIGEIVHVNDKAAQPMFEIENGDVEIFIPMIDDFIKKIDRDNKQIHVETPEGLIDLYLNYNIINLI